jgi:hypothetical protein
MTRNQIRITLLSGFALVAALIASRPVAAQDATEPYLKMAPIELGPMYDRQCTT